MKSGVVRLIADMDDFRLLYEGCCCSVGDDCVEEALRHDVIEEVEQRRLIILFIDLDLDSRRRSSANNNMGDEGPSDG